jgi:hypothetical protein
VCDSKLFCCLHSAFHAIGKASLCSAKQLVCWLPVCWLPVCWLPVCWLPVCWLPVCWLPVCWLPVCWLPVCCPGSNCILRGLLPDMHAYRLPCMHLASHFPAPYACSHVLVSPLHLTDRANILCVQNCICTCSRTFYLRRTLPQASPSPRSRCCPT